MVEARPSPPPPPSVRKDGRAGPRAGAPSTLLPAAAILVIILILAARSPSGAVGPSASSNGPLLWIGDGTAENGVLRMSISSLGAGASAGPLSGAPGADLSVRLLGFEELGSYGAILASTSFPGGAAGPVPGWTAFNASAPSGLSVRFFGSLEVVRPTGAVVPQPADANATVASGSTPGTAGNLSLSVDLRNWPWVRATDSLVAFFAVAPADPSAGAVANGTTDTLNCGPLPAGGNVSEFASWSANALAVDSAGDRFQIPTAAAVQGGPSGATLAVGIPGGSGGYTEVGLSVTVAIPSTPSAAPLAPGLVLLCVGWAAVVGGVAWIALGRANERRPS